MRETKKERGKRPCLPSTSLLEVEDIITFVYSPIHVGTNALLAAHFVRFFKVLPWKSSHLEREEEEEELLQPEGRKLARVRREHLGVRNQVPVLLRYG